MLAELANLNHCALRSTLFKPRRRQLELVRYYNVSAVSDPHSLICLLTKL